jgi:transcriptional regulator with XRE-family HTH domain
VISLSSFFSSSFAKNLNIFMSNFIGNNIKRLRDNAGLTQERAARLVGVTFQLWNKWEKGKHKPSGGKILKICEAFKVELFGIPLAPSSPGQNFQVEGDAMREIISLAETVLEDNDRTRKDLEKLIEKMKAMQGHPLEMEEDRKI